MNTNNKIEWGVCVNGRPVRVYHHEGRSYIESRENTEYTIEIKNNNWFRVEAVVTVDGLSVLNGNSGSLEDRGYIIQGYDKLVIKGFRKSNEEVGAFKFTKKENAYATQKGEGNNVGVIAVAVFDEKQNYYNTLIGASISNGSGNQFFNTGTPVLDHHHTYATNCTINMASVDSCTTGGLLRSHSSDFNHGTTWGKKIQDKVTTVSFERISSVPSFASEVYYNSKEKLEEFGIKLIPEKNIAFPVAFPKSPIYATPPVGWNG